MARPSLPTVGGSTDTWGTELNSVLSNAHNELDSCGRVTPFVSGRYYDHRMFFPSDQYGQAMTANRMYATPIVVPGDGLAIDRIGIQVDTSSAGNARLGAYEADGTEFAPGTLIFDAGTVSTGTTGAKEITVSQTLDPGIPERIVWLVAVFDATPSVRSTYEANYAIGLGLTTAGDQTSVVAGYYRSFTYGALPDPFGGTLTVTRFVPSIFVRAT